MAGGRREASRPPVAAAGPAADAGRPDVVGPGFCTTGSRNCALGWAVPPVPRPPGADAEATALGTGLPACRPGWAFWVVTAAPAAEGVAEDTAPTDPMMEFRSIPSVAASAALTAAIMAS